jgi:hypothetical protein
MLNGETDAARMLTGGTKHIGNVRY